MKVLGWYQHCLLNAHLFKAACSTPGRDQSRDARKLVVIGLGFMTTAARACKIDAPRGANQRVVSSADRAIQDTFRRLPQRRPLDLSGQLGDAVESLSACEGIG